MALVIEDRVRETTAVTGTNDAILLGAVVGFQSFSVIGNTNTTYYTIADQAGSAWEVGIGTYSTSGPTLQRTTVLASSNGGAKVVFSSGTKDVFVTYPSDKAVYLDASGDVQPALGNVVASQVDITAQGDLRLQDTSGGQYVALQAPGTVATSYTLTLPVDDGTNGQALITDGSGVLSWSTAASGDVYGPASATDNAVARFDGTTGKIIQNSAVTIADTTGDITTAGYLITAAGAVGTPAITTTGDTNTGIFFPAADTIAFTEGGAEAMRISSSGQIGIGTNAPDTLITTVPATDTDYSIHFGTKNYQTAYGTKIYVQSENEAGTVSSFSNIIKFVTSVNTRSNVQQWLSFTSSSPTSDYQYWSTGGSERIRITGAGNIGIGTSSPDALLSVNGIASFGDGAAATPSITNFGDLNTGFWFPAADTIAASTAGAEAMRITSSAQLYINTTNWPITTFGNSAGRHIFGGSNTPIILLWNESAAAADNFSQISLGAKSGVSATSWAGGSILGATLNNSDNSGYLTFLTTNAAGANIQHMRITSTGLVGIGTSSPLAKLEISAANEVLASAGIVQIGAATAGADVGGQITFRNSDARRAAIAGRQEGAGATAGYLQFGTRGSSGDVTERMRIDSAGNVGIGVTSPTVKLAVAGDININDTQAYRSGAQLLLSRTNSTGEIRLGSGAAADYLGLYAGAAERMRIDTSGNVLIGKTSATANGGDLQVSSGITFPATQVAKSNANTLDDYEEGTWTPVLEGSTTAGTYVYDTDRTGGNYTKIGNTVFIRGVIRVTSTTSAGSGSARIAGLPFATINPDTSWNRLPGSLALQSGPTLANSSIFVHTDGASTTYLGVGIQGTATWTAATVAEVATDNAIWFFEIQYNV